MNAAPKQHDCTLIATNRHPPIDDCCVCGSRPNVWRHHEQDGEARVVVCCGNGPTYEADGSALDTAGCLLYFPPESFFRARIIEAVDHWNAYQRACVAMRSK